MDKEQFEFIIDRALYGCYEVWCFMRDNNLRLKGYVNVDGYGYAKVYENAEAYDDVKIYGNAKVYGYATVQWNTKVYGIDEVY